ncbi:exonuclease domain-containing protein [Ferrimonas balearica]|uniref:exonuclease domain-containing protein n=1 Tax=Ferrimonas balearica TaxID=44012 RepID=UPI001C996938|nr:exonuclease domain-containing protein [Ferrimonas balearica]MBY5992520.1 3'-5' exoribonuclease [Ferrimonas balearica]
MAGFFMSVTITVILLIGAMLLFIHALRKDDKLHDDRKADAYRKAPRQPRTKTMSETDMHDNKMLISGIKSRLDLEDCLFIDTETTGLGNTDQVIEIAIINGHGEILLDTLIKPTIQIPEDAIRIHGITNEMVKNAQTVDAIADDFRRIVEGKKLFAYNAKFDSRLLRQSFHSVGESFPRAEWFCVMDSFSEFNGKRTSLINAAASFGYVPEEKAHRALTDAMMCLEVFAAMRIYDGDIQPDTPKEAENLKGKRVVFTGQMKTGSRAQMKKLASSLGMVNQSSVGNKTDFVVIGDEGDERWANGTYGRKIEEAIARVKAGQEINIIKESEWREMTGL